MTKIYCHNEKCLFHENGECDRPYLIMNSCKSYQSRNLTSHIDDCADCDDCADFEENEEK